MVMNESLELLARAAKTADEKRCQAVRGFLNLAYDLIAADRGRLPARTAMPSYKSADLEKKIIEELMAASTGYDLQWEIPESTIREFALELQSMQYH